MLKRGRRVNKAKETEKDESDAAPSVVDFSKGSKFSIQAKKIREADLLVLARAISTSQHVAQLRLRSTNIIGSAGMQAFSQAIATHRNLVELE